MWIIQVYWQGIYENKHERSLSTFVKIEPGCCVYYVLQKHREKYKEFEGRIGWGDIGIESLCSGKKSGAVVQRMIPNFICYKSCGVCLGFIFCSKQLFVYDMPNN